MTEESVNALRAIVEDSLSDVSAPLEGTEKLIADIYTGRDPLGGAANLVLGDGGWPWNDIPDPTSTSKWTPPETTANLFLSRVRQIVTQLTPGVPSIKVKSRVPGTSSLADYQNEITRFATDHGGLRDAMRRGAFLGLLSPYFGVKLVINDDEEAYEWEKVQFECVESSDCGYEPFQRRANWHSYNKQWGDLPPKWKPDFGTDSKPHDWDLVRVTEVYHPGFQFGAKDMGMCPMSVFVSNSVGRQVDGQFQGNVANALGHYVGSYALPECPLVIGSFLDSAPNEDVPPAEVLSWIPLMRMIVQVLVQINREITTVNKTVLYDKNAISEEAMDYIKIAAPGSTVFIGVDADDTTRGVNATMRPVEQNSILSEYMAALSTYMQLFDDITGVGPIERGGAMNPRKSATEAAAITSAASRRNQDRLEVIAGMWSKVAHAHHMFQEYVYPTTINIPLPNGIMRKIPVPQGDVASFAFEVDPIEIGHMSQRGEIDTHMNWLTVTTNTQQSFPQGVPRMTREALRKLGKVMGIEDVDLFLDVPTIEVGPEDRYIKHLQTGQPIQVHEDDQHDMYLAYYSKKLQEALEADIPGASVLGLEQAIATHQRHSARRQEAINQQQMGEIMPGMGMGPGEVDNNSAAALAAGMQPPPTPQATGPL